MHRGRNDTAANANANSDAPPQNSLAKFCHHNPNEKVAKEALRMNSIAIANGLAN